MNSSFVKRIVNALCSLELTLILLVIFAIAIAAATFLEGEFGTAGSQALVYGARWFELLLGLLTLNLVFTLGMWFPFQARRLGFIMVHVSMIVILLGAGMTRYLGQEGSIHIRQGSRSGYMLSREPHVQVTVDGELKSFPVRLYRDGQSMSRHLKFAGGTYRVSVAEYWPRYAPGAEVASAEAEGSEPGLQLTVNTDAASMVTLRRGKQHLVDGIRLGYLDSTVLSTVGDQPLGALRVTSGGSSTTVPVSEDPSATVEVGGFMISITEFQADFSVGSNSEGPSRMTNPMIRVRVRAPDGASEERMLFAYFPEFAQQHSQPEGVFTGVETAYQFEQRLLFAGQGESLVARSSVPLLELSTDGTGDGQNVLPPGREFKVTPLTVYRTPRNDFSVVLRASVAAESGGSTGAEEASPAMRLVVEDTGGESVSTLLVQGTRGVPEKLGDHDLTMAFGSVQIDLPYELGLDDFRLLTYPGSDRPSGYESHVKLFDAEQGIDGRPAVIRMNSPLTHRGYKHFQSSYDTDNRGTILSVNQDPGKWPTYIGYALITLGFLLSLLKNVIWRWRAEGTR